MAGHQRLERPQFKICADGVSRLCAHRPHRYCIPPRYLACGERRHRISPSVRSWRWYPREQRLPGSNVRFVGGAGWKRLFRRPLAKPAARGGGKGPHFTRATNHSGYPDQTCDWWVVRGVSAYSGGLWLAALRAAEESARILGEAQTADEYHALFLKGQKTYIAQLWNGEYFRYDTNSESKDAIQADQLAGQWYANLTGLGDTVPRRMEISTLKKIFAFNVMKFGNGEMGAANGMNPDGSVLNSNEQAKEVWVGTTESYAGLLMSEGLKDEAYKSTWGLYHVIYESKGYWFRTPEAWDITGNFRAGMYMRPTAIWALEMTPPRAK